MTSVVNRTHSPSRVAEKERICPANARSKPWALIDEAARRRTGTLHGSKQLSTNWLVLRIGLALLAGILLQEPALALEVTRADCGPLSNSVGPYDYRVEVRTKSEILSNVEGHHFTPNVENLIKGESSYIGSDINYVLRAFPNHHRALVSLLRLAERSNSENIPGLLRPVSCWYLRAMDFAPDDAAVHSIYAVHLYRTKHLAQATEQIDSAIKLGATDGNTYYNAGLIYFANKDYPKALEYAKKAYESGYALVGLRKKLESVGQWRD
jgi:tetratricopeptide (TPR) repeat protein